MAARSRVIRLLEPAVNTRKMLSVSMEADSLEMVDKLALFFGKQTGQKFSRNLIIEEAVNGFIDDSTKIIQERYDVNIRMIPIAELSRNSYVQTIDVAAFDTVIVPAKDNDAYREAFFIKRQWPNVRIRERKLRSMRYLAVYVGTPTSAITHYARIASYHTDPDNAGRYVIVLGAPVALPHAVDIGDPSLAAGMRSCRYTSLQLLQNAMTVQDIFPQGT